METARLAFSFSLLLVSLLTMSYPYSADARQVANKTDQCKAAILSSAHAFSAKYVASLTKCESKALDHKTRDCRFDARVLRTRQAAIKKLNKVIAKACGGTNHSCDSADSSPNSDDVPLSSLGWIAPVCPDFEHSGCDNKIDDCEGVGACLSCVLTQSIDEAVVTPLVDILPNEVSSEKVVCQHAILEGAATLHNRIFEALATCRDGGQSCPDLTSLNEISAAQDDFASSTCLACGSGSEICGGTGSFSARDLGLPDTCKAIATQSGSFCGRDIRTIADFARIVLDASMCTPANVRTASESTGLKGTSRRVAPRGHHK